MPRRVVIADCAATSRIALKAALTAARYDVTAVGSGAAALELHREAAVDLVLLDEAAAESHLGAFGNALPLPELPPPAVAVICDGATPAQRCAWLERGAVAILDRPVRRSWLLTHARALVRAHETRAELYRQNATAARLGFAEMADGFDRRPRAIAAGGSRAQTGALIRSLRGDLAVEIELADDDTLLARADSAAPPDLVILPRRADPREQTLWILSELRARPATRRAAIVVEYSAEQEDAAAMALDLGASCVVPSGASPREKALTVGRALTDKLALDRLRENLEAGLALAARDELTKLWNRRYALQHLETLATRPQDAGRGFGVILADLDGFKAINDRFGHLIGDMVLADVAGTLARSVREIDLVARFGGEEFLVVIPDTSPQELLAAAERLREAVGGHTVPTAAGPINLTVSLGAACLSGVTARTAIALADEALYAAKNGGRNRSVLSPQGGCLAHLAARQGHVDAQRTA
ncbi:diguanylate cyclase [Palleronia sediminis]|uniref:diguanylate cyclase n=1 Tax=Palleronia sediminis TaxID=2547833 RepID=A0A4R6AA07_9RHOB|nr:diguanylate cyclase [Palleronia sediminis]TDL79682.1 diguanylate cyclase [Palleronia sediminis]